MPSQELITLAAFLERGRLLVGGSFRKETNSILCALADLGRDGEPDDDIKVPINRFFFFTKDRHDNSQRAQVVPLLKEAGRV